MTTFRTFVGTLLLGALQAPAQTTISVDNLRVWYSAGNQFTGSSNAGTLAINPSAPNWPNGASGQTQTDARMRIEGLDLDGVGGNDDYIDFSLRFEASRSSSPQLDWSGSGIGVNGDLSPGSDEVLTVSVVDVSLSPGVPGTVTFNGFAAASIYLGGTGILTDGKLDVNGVPFTNGFDATAGFTYNISKVTQAGLPATVVLNNILTSDGDLRWREGDLRFTYQSASPPPVVLTTNDLNLRSNGEIYPNAGGASQGGANLGKIVPRPGFDLTAVNQSPTTDLLLRWENLNLDGSGGNNDYFDFTLRASTGTADNVTFTAEGIGISGNGTNGLDPGEVLSFEVVDIQLSPGTSGSVGFDGFTEAGFFASGNGNPNPTTGSASCAVNGNTVTVNLNGSAYTSSTSHASFSTAASVVFENPVYTPGSITPIGRARDFDLRFAYTQSPAQGLPVHGLTLKPTAQDLDGNGLPDVWEALFGAKGVDPMADSDGDGVPNKDEGIAGTDPFNPQDALKSSIQATGTDQADISWTALSQRKGALESTTDLSVPSSWQPHAGSPSLATGKWKLTVPTTDPRRFFRVRATEDDTDSDGVPDWIESKIGFATSAANSVSQSISYDTNNDQIPDTTLSGDLAAFNEIYRSAEAGTRPTRAQAARFLMQATFGAPDQATIDNLVAMGIPAWIDQQMALPVTDTSTYILTIKADWLAGSTNPALAGYAADETLFRGLNFMTAWARNALTAPDQLRQRVAFALSQIVVTSSSACGLGNQPQAMSNFYDSYLDYAFGSYEDFLLQASLSPVMGTYLSSLGNRKEDVALGRFPDENYAREIMQLFTVGLWELNPDGTQKLDGNGQPIPTYTNGDITQLAKVFTGTNYAANNFGGGWRDDGIYMTTPMKVFASEHDFSAKTVVIGNGAKHTIPARSSSDANALQDVKDAVAKLVRHPNTAPFISRQLIQFLVTANPSPDYVERVATVFANTVGDLGEVVRAILLDDEARNPLEHLRTPYFGGLREPTVRTMHLGRVLKIANNTNFLWWDWGTYRNASLQEPMAAPTVFNYFRPDFKLFGELAQKQIDSPVFGITDSYSAISFPNHLWSVCNNGFRDGNNKNYPGNFTDLAAIAGNVPALLDHLSLIFCGGTLSAQSRATITTSLNATSDLTDRARLAAYLVLMSPEGACLK